MSLLGWMARKALLNGPVFDLLQRCGVHVTANHFYDPVPDTRELARRRDLWEVEQELPGVDQNLEAQLRMLEEVFPRFAGECRFPLEAGPEPHEYHVKNGAFGLVSAAVLHCMIRHHRPRLILEVGAGNSTLVSARACRKLASLGHETRLISIEPHPGEVLRRGFPGLTRLIPERVERVGLQTFAELDHDDILFIDSSHVVRLGGDVNFLFLEVLPRLRPGVVVHVHDIFFPKNYPRDWVLKNRRFWTEQYLLQGFLAFNSGFEVLWCGSSMYRTHRDRLLAVFPPPAGLAIEENYFSSSFWMRRI